MSSLSLVLLSSSSEEDNEVDESLLSDDELLEELSKSLLLLLLLDSLEDLDLNNNEKVCGFTHTHTHTLIDRLLKITKKKNQTKLLLKYQQYNQDFTFFSLFSFHSEPQVHL